MTIIEQTRDILTADGYPAILSAVEGKDPSWAPLVVPFRPDELGREMILYLQVMPYGPNDEVSFVNHCLLYPLQFVEQQPTAELIRAVFLLNRYLPLGHNSICEQTPVIYYAHQQVVWTGYDVSADVVKETVNMIGYFTRQHGQILSNIFRGDATCEDFLLEMELVGAPMVPLIANFNDSPHTISKP